MHQLGRLLTFGMLTLASARRAHAADDRRSVTPPETATAAAPSGRLAFSAAYLGEFLMHPGAVLGAEFRLTPRVRPTLSGAELILAGNLGSYVHVRNHVGVLLDAELGARYGFRSGVFLDGFAGAGYLHTFLAAPVYTVSASGNVDRVTDLGRPAFMPVLGVGGGYRSRDWAGFLRFETFGQYPFNQHLLPHLAVLVGVRVTASGVSL